MPLSYGSFYLNGASIFGFVKTTRRPSKATLFENSSKNTLFLYTLLTIFATQSYTKRCRDCNQQIRIDQVNGKWAAYELDESGFQTCKQQQPKNA